MDELDSALVTLLQRDARQTNRELARALGIAPSTCLERVRALHRRGVIVGHHAKVDLSRIGRPVQALVAVRLRPPNRPVIESFQQFVTQLPETLSVFVVSGAEDFLIHVAVRDTEHLHAFVLDHLTQRREIADVRTSVVFQHMHKPVAEPLPGRSAPSDRRGRGGYGGPDGDGR
ncbi:AsnC family transcriptional regulator [Streptomyces carminius]|uniref:AsnC family transcriptional regulator n=1 Tax=Streptomyces carminius TaxID=2665496 RepID=A0A2M8LVU7_9ACTN|nr:Lrp/AsnC family transcriptional regulator [Streptomyces carminius]PJE96084.1 AsnC family transcriptional regulator [Streptomyces carminius]